MPQRVKNWLILRGLGRTAAHWGNFPEHMAKHLGAQVMTLDLPGVGQEYLKAAPRTVSGYVHQLRERWLSRISNGESAANHIGTCGIWGLSFGGMIALEWIHLFPEDFERAVISSTSAANCSLPWERLRPRAAALMAKTLTVNTIAEKEEIILNMISRRADRKSIVPQWTEATEKNPIPAKSVTNQFMAAAAFRAPPLISTKSLFLTSWGDQMVHPVVTIRLAKKYNSVISLHDEAGHDLALDAPEWCLKEIKSFLS